MKKLTVVLCAVMLIFACSGSVFAGEYDNLKPVSLRYGNGAALGAAGDLWGIAFCRQVEKLPEARSRSIISATASLVSTVNSRHRCWRGTSI